MKHEAASRFDEKYNTNKCPICKTMSQTYLKVSDGLLACTNCNVVFVAKHVMDDFKLNIKDILTKQEQDRSGWVCDFPECGFKAKSKAGLVTHQKKHE